MPESRPRRAQSVLEFLTAKNPRVSIANNIKMPNTMNSTYYKPRALRPWEEFTYSTLEQVFGAELMKEAQRRQPRDVLPHYPHMDPAVLKPGRHHSSTVDILSKWNHTIVVAALRAVQDTLNPCIWTSEFGRDLSKDRVAFFMSAALHADQQADNESNCAGCHRCDGEQSESDEERLEPKPRRYRPKAPDGGAISLREEQEGRNVFEELFPKEIKTVYNWNSQKLRDGLYTNARTGQWIGTAGEKNDNAPIRQAYTYCVNYRCRYGCILTTEEAFIFRIKPRGRELPVPSPNDPTLIRQVKFNGLMEYVSVPWENGCDRQHHEYKQWTVNLALWFTHILAGNNHKLDWGYKRLCDERLAAESGRPLKRSRRVSRVVGSASNTVRRQEEPVRPAPKKRKRTQDRAPSEESVDVANFSVVGHSVPQPRNPLGSYQADADDRETTVDRDLELPPLKRRLISALSTAYEGVEWSPRQWIMS